MPLPGSPGPHIFRGVEVEGSVIEGPRGDPAGISLDHGLGPVVVGQRLQFGKARLVEQGGNAEGACITRSNDGSAGLGVLVNEVADDLGIYRGLITGQDDDRRSGDDGVQAGPERAAHAALPVLIVHHHRVQVGDGVFHGFTPMARHHADDVAAPLLRGADGGVNECLAVVLEQLFGLTQACGAACGQDYAADSMHRMLEGTV